MKNTRTLRILQAAASMLALAAAWQILSYAVPALPVSAGPGHHQPHH